MSLTRNLFVAAAVTLVALAVAGPAGAAFVGALTVGQAIGIGSVVYSVLAGRDAKRAADANRRQRELTYRSSTGPRQRVYGQARVGGLLNYWVTHGDDFRDLSLVVVFADHRCAGIDDILIEDKPLGALTSEGEVQVGSYWFKQQTLTSSYNVPAVAGVITLLEVPVSPATVTVTTYVQVISGGEGNDVSPEKQRETLVLGVDFEHVVPSQTVTLIGAYAGRSFGADEITVSHQTEYGTSLVRAKKYLGVPGQTADAQLIADSGGEWNANCTLDGQTYAIITIRWDDQKAISGLPNVSAIMRGALLYDPRKDSTVTAGGGGSGPHRANDPSTWEYENNWTLCLRDYLVYQFGATAAKIQELDTFQSANTSDELVTTADGTVRRYTINGVIYADEDSGDVLEEMALAGAGTCVWSGDKWRILCGAYRSPVTIALTDSDLAGPVRYRGSPPAVETFNAVRGTFYDKRPTNGVLLYTKTEYVPYASSAFQTEDNGRQLFKTINFRFVDDYRVAHRIAKQILFRARQGATLTITCSLRALPLQVGDVVLCTFSRYGIVNKAFEILDYAYNFPSTIDLVLQETDGTVYNWSYTEVANLDPAPNTLLADPTVVDVVQVTAYTNPADTVETLPDGTVNPYTLLTWPARGSAGEYVVIWWKRSYELHYQRLVAKEQETSLKIRGVSGGEVLQFECYAYNALNVPSDPWIIQEHRIPLDMPRAGSKGTSLTQNLLPSASFDDGVLGRWGAPYGVGGTGDATLSVSRHPLPAYYVSGTPGSVNLVITDAYAGTGKGAVWPSDLIAVKSDTRYCAYVGLIPWGCDAFISLAWYDINLVWIGNVDGSVVSGVPVEDPTKRWNNPAAYDNAVTFQVPPPNAKYARVLIVAGGVWTGAVEKYVSIHKPYFGELADGNVIPPWGPGGATPVTTSQLAINATYEVYRQVGSDVQISLPLGNLTDLVSTFRLPLNAANLAVDLGGRDVTVSCSFDLTVGPHTTLADAYAIAQVTWAASGIGEQYGQARTLLRESLASGASKTVNCQVVQRFRMPSTGVAPTWEFYLRAGCKSVVPSTISTPEWGVEILKV